MTLTKAQAGLGLATAILAFAGAVAGGTLWFSKRFSEMETRMQKMESAVKVLNASTIDERYKQAIKELMAEEKENRSPLTGQPGQRFGGNSLPTDGGASASAPSASHGYTRKDSTTHRYLCSHDGEPEVPCEVLFPPLAGTAADAPAAKPPQ